jgi:uncharacterized tellurite resistance protein B-like protein
MKTKITLPEVTPIVKEYMNIPGNSAGGSLHIVLEDGNILDSDIEYCIQIAKEKGDLKGMELGFLIKRLSKTQRKKLSSMLYTLYD